jgi:hypothetical protein
VSAALDTPISGVRVDRLPAWPILLMLWGFPVFWVLGMTVVPAAVTMTGVMVAFLAQQRNVAIVPGVGALLAFTAWMVPTALMLDSMPRALGFVYRFAIVVFALVALIYTLNARRHLTLRSVVNGLTFVWMFTIVGGILGMIFPNARLTTPVGLVMPASLTSNEYVRDLFFPPFAEVQHPWGSPEAFLRPSAPFPYANSWGVAILILTPVAVAAFLLARSWLTRFGIIVAAVAMVPPAVATSNRGMFAALGLAVVYVVVRLALRNRAAPVLGLGAFGVAVVFFVLSRGLVDQIAARQQYGQSTEARFSLYVETISRTLDSPLLGYGAPRPSSAVENLSVGTQGYVWTVMFSHGFIGLALFLLFLWGTTVRTWRAPSDIQLVLHSVLVVTSLAILVYGLDIMQMLSVVLVAALLLRRRYGLDEDDGP